MLLLLAGVARHTEAAAVITTETHGIVIIVIPLRLKLAAVRGLTTTTAEIIIRMYFMTWMVLL